MHSGTLLHRLQQAQAQVVAPAPSALIAEIMVIVAREFESTDVAPTRMQLIEHAVTAAEHAADAQQAVELVEGQMVTDGMRDRPSEDDRTQHGRPVAWSDEVRDRLKGARARRAEALNILGDHLDVLLQEIA